MSEKKWLRGDPDRPFPADLAKLNELKARYVHPTHEPLWFYRNRGTASPQSEAQANGYQTVENVELAAAMGLHIPKRAHFFKGFGLERERPFIDRTVAYARELHARGMMVSVYVGGTLFPEYFLKEVPEAIDWFRKDQYGLPITYSSYQLMRWFPCLNHPDYRAYLKRVLDIAVEEIEADEIFFDNQILRHEPRSCRCDHCVEHFRRMIRQRYSLEEIEERYGLAEYPDPVPPIWSQACKPWRMDEVQRPQMQDWIDHRVQTVVEFYRDMAEHVKARKPDVAVGMNIKGVHGHNRAMNHGICHGAFADVLDFSCIDGNRPGCRGGAIRSEVRFYKSSHSTRVSVVEIGGSELAAAESEVVGYHKHVAGHGWLTDIYSSPVFTPMTQFLRGNRRLFHERRHLHDVAVLRSEPATNYNCAKVHEQLMAFEKTLAVEKVPWGIIYDRQIDEIDRFRVVALPEIQALSDRWVDRLDAFLRAGGGVIASGRAAAFDAWYRPRDPEHALARWLGHRPRGEYEVAEVGKGRFVYVPGWEVATRWDFSDWFGIWGDNDLPLPDRGQFRRAINDATVGRPLTHEVAGPDAVFVEAIAAAEGPDGGVDLHFLNYDPDSPAGELAVRAALPAGCGAAKVVLTDPHDENHRSWEADACIADGAAEFAMFVPKVYGLAQVTFQGDK